MFLSKNRKNNNSTTTSSSDMLKTQQSLVAKSLLYVVSVTRFLDFIYSF